MIIGGMYSFNGGREKVEQTYPDLLDEIKAVIGAVDAEQYKIKVSKEKTMSGRLLYQPSSLNSAFKEEFHSRGWINRRIPSIYSQDYYVLEYQRRVTARNAFRDMDFVKDKLGIEVQFGKYFFHGL